jgi:hypothetical protein
LLLACSEHQEVRLGDGLGSGNAGAGAGGQAGSSGSAGTSGGGSSGAGGSSSGEGGQGAGPFSEPSEVGDPAEVDGAVGTPKYDDPSVTRDLKQLFFNGDFPEDDTKNEDIYVATRVEPGSDWGQGAAVAELNSEDRETGIAIAPDGLTIWFSSDRDGDNLDVYTSTRENDASTWSEPVKVSNLSTDKDDLVSGISSDELTLTLALREVPDGDYDIYSSTRTSKDADFPEATAMDAFNTEGKDGDAAIVGIDGLDLVFTHGADGGHGDLFMAKRASTNNQFGTDDVQELEELNTEWDERDAWVSEDLRYIIFSSNRKDKIEDSYQLYEAYR